MPRSHEVSLIGLFSLFMGVERQFRVEGPTCLKKTRFPALRARPQRAMTLGTTEYHAGKITFEEWDPRAIRAPAKLSTEMAEIHADAHLDNISCYYCVCVAVNQARRTTHVNTSHEQQPTMSSSYDSPGTPGHSCTGISEIESQNISGTSSCGHISCRTKVFDIHMASHVICRAISRDPHVLLRNHVPHTHVHSRTHASYIHKVYGAATHPNIIT